MRPSSGIACKELADQPAEDCCISRSAFLPATATQRGNKLIAAELDISEGTVKTHMKSILPKLDAADRTHAVMIALRRGILDL